MREIKISPTSKLKKKLPVLSPHRQEKLELLINNQPKLKKILFDTVVNYRMLTWGMDSDLAIEIRSMFNQLLRDNLQARILKHPNLLAEQKVDSGELVVCLKELVKKLTHDKIKNNVWFTQLLVSIYRNHSYSEYFTHRPPAEIIRNEQIFLLGAHYRLVNKHNSRNTYIEQSQQHSKHNLQIIDRIFASIPEEAQELLFYESFPLSVSLALIIALLLLKLTFSLLDKNDLSCPTAMQLGAVCCLFLFFFLKRNTIEATLGVLQSGVGFELQQSYFTFDHLPALFQRSLNQDLIDLIIPPKESYVERVKPVSRAVYEQRHTRPIQQPVYTSIRMAPLPPSIVESKQKEEKPIAEKDTNLLASQRRQRTAKYLATPSSIPRAPIEIEEIVVWKNVPNLKHKNSYLSELVWRVDQVGHKELFRLWSTCANRFDPYQSYCVFFNPPPIDPDLEQAFRMTASMGRVVGRKDEAGFVKLAQKSDDINDFPKFKDSQDQERPPQFKIKIMHKLFASQRMPVYVYEEKVKSNKGNEFTLCLTGDSHNSK